MRKKFLTALLFLFIIILGKLINIMYYSKTDYDELLINKSNIYISGPSSPRGKIMDINGKIIVDNEPVNTIFYHKVSGVTLKEEIHIAEVLSNYLTFKNEISDNILKKYWIVKNKDLANNLITENEHNLYQKRKLSKSELEDLKLKRIKKALLKDINPYEAYIYYLMNKGYIYENKIILENVPDEVYANIIELGLPGVFGDFTWKRVYPYKDTLKSILGSVGNIPKDNKDEYLKKGYQINDIIGTSYLELQYEQYLKGTKALYEVGKDNSLILKKEAKSGNDLILSIDIDKQLKIESILQEKILKAKNEANTNFYKDSYAIVSDPSTGKIIAMSGKRYINKDTWQDVTSNIINNSFTVGSVVKGATIAVGYQNNIIDIGTKMKDSCIKLYLTPQKCSFKKLGVVDDVTALMNSSNYYQFQIAIGLTGHKYKNNMKINASPKHFEIYRDTLESFGLGGKTKIDLPNETEGIKGNIISDDLLLNLAIGQYDTYTPIEVLQYINTIANNGKKYAPTLMDSIKNDGLVIKENNDNYISHIPLEKKYLDRIRKGMNLVLMKGTGRGHVSYSLNPAGKTGTSESFYDSNNDGKNDVKTVTKTFAGFVPFDNPKYSIVVISPNVSYDNAKNSYTSNVNRHITRAITDFLFEI